MTGGWTTVAPALVVAWALLLWWVERLRPYERGPFLREGFVTDLFLYTFAQSYVCALAIGALIGALDGATGLSRLALVGAWPLWVQVAFFLVTHDLYIYWFHRWQHANPVLWRLHEAHHSSRRIDWVAGLRSHALEILINQTVEFAPMVLLGAAPEVPLIKSLIGAVWGLWIHANVDVRTGPLQWVVNGPEAHRWHHAMDLDAQGRNFATKLAIWDRLFGTAWLPPDRRPERYGLSDGGSFPCDYLRQQLFAFRPFPSTSGP